MPDVEPDLDSARAPEAHVLEHEGAVADQETLEEGYSMNSS
jgi:hypothetical protein